MKLPVFEFRFNNTVPHLQRDAIMAIPPYAFVGPHSVDPPTQRDPFDCDYYRSFVTEQEAREYFDQIKKYPDVNTSSIKYEVFVPSGAKT